MGDQREASVTSGLPSAPASRSARPRSAGRSPLVWFAVASAITVVLTVLALVVGLIVFVATMAPHGAPLPEQTSRPAATTGR